MRRSHSALRHSPHTQTGFSLVEMMIAITLGLLVLGGATSVFSSTLGTNSAVMKNTRLNQDVRSAMEFMARDVRRSGYFSGNTTTTINPFQDELSVGNPNDCILYAYDTKKDGTLAADDKLGFRLYNNSLQVRRAGAACNASTSWENITDPNALKVNSLKFTVAPVFCTNVTTTLHQNCLGSNQNANEIFALTYDVTIELTAALVSDASIAVTAKQIVRVKNESVIKK